MTERIKKLRWYSGVSAHVRRSVELRWPILAISLAAIYVIPAYALVGGKASEPNDRPSSHSTRAVLARSTTTTGADLDAGEDDSGATLAEAAHPAAPTDLGFAVFADLELQVTLTTGELSVYPGWSGAAGIRHGIFLLGLAFDYANWSLAGDSGTKNAYSGYLTRPLLGIGGMTGLESQGQRGKTWQPIFGLDARFERLGGTDERGPTTRWVQGFRGSFAARFGLQSTASGSGEFFTVGIRLGVSALVGADYGSASGSRELSAHPNFFLGLGFGSGYAPEAN